MFIFKIVCSENFIDNYTTEKYIISDDIELTKVRVYNSIYSDYNEIGHNLLKNNYMLCNINFNINYPEFVIELNTDNEIKQYFCEYMI